MSESRLEQMLKDSISDFLVDELEDHLSGEKLESAKQMLSKKIVTEDDIDELKESLESLSDELPEDFIDYLWEEVDEIEDDVEWAASDKGKEIISINRWSDQFYDEFRSMDEFNEVMIGGHTEQSTILVAGEVNQESDIQKLKDYVASKNPPLEVMWKVKVIK